MPRLTTVKVQYESKIKIYGQNLVYGEDLRSLTLKTKNWGNNHLSRRFGKYSFQALEGLKFQALEGLKSNAQPDELNFKPSS